MRVTVFGTGAAVLVCALVALGVRSRSVEMGVERGIAPNGSSGVAIPETRPGRDPRQPIAGWGVVEDPHGQPLRDADLTLYDLEGTRDVLRAPSKAPLPRRTRSTENGRFEFGCVEPGQKVIVIEHSAHAISWSDVLEVGPSGGLSGLRLRVPGSAGLEGFVVGEDGRAIQARVEVAFRVPGRDGCGAGGQIVHGGPVGPDGRFQVGRLPAQAHLVVRTTADEHMTDERLLEPIGETTQSLTVLLRLGAAIEGQILDEEGHPVAGAKLSAAQGRGESRDTISDERGRFRLGGLRREWASVVVSKAGHGTVQISGLKPETPAQIVLPRMAKVAGEARNACGLYVAHEAGGAVYRAPIADDGRFVLACVSRGRAELRIERRDGSVVERHEVTVPDRGDVHGVRIMVAGGER